jgi:hypothetical protein
MLTRGEDVEVDALRQRGWSISAIARHLGRDPIYLRGVLSGFREAEAGDKRFEWQGILVLGRWVIAGGSHTPAGFPGVQMSCKNLASVGDGFEHTPIASRPDRPRQSDCRRGGERRRPPR